MVAMSVGSKDDGPMNDRRRDETTPVLLAGGNPQIPKGEGDGPVQDYIAAMPGWKRAVGERLDSLVVQTVPDVHKTHTGNALSPVPQAPAHAPPERARAFQELWADPAKTSVGCGIYR